jgi:hypothetical protein
MRGKVARSGVVCKGVEQSEFHANKIRFVQLIFL